MSKEAKHKALEERARRYLKAELKRAGVTYEELALRLNKQGFPDESKASIASKLSRGSFSATFMIATLKAIGRETVTLADV
jgi:hypothetical protein